MSSAQVVGPQRLKPKEDAYEVMPMCGPRDFIKGNTWSEYQIPDAVNVFKTQSSPHANKPATSRNNGKICRNVLPCQILSWCVYVIMGAILLTMSCFMTARKDSRTILCWIGISLFYMWWAFVMVPVKFDSKIVRFFFFILNYSWFGIGSLYVYLNPLELDYVTKLRAFFLPTLVLLLLLPSYSIVSMIRRWYQRND